MLKFDHVVVHANGNDEINAWKHVLDAAQVPFDPSHGKKAAGFQVSNVWVGLQYFEIVDILKEKNQWQARWAERHAKGDRGAYCVFFSVDTDIEEVYAKLKSAGITCSEPEQTQFKMLFGWIVKRMPWRFMLLPKIPGTDIEVGLIQYNPGVQEKNAPNLLPNSKELGLTGLSTPAVRSNDVPAAQSYVDQLNAALGVELDIQLDVMEQGAAKVSLTGEYDKTSTLQGFSLGDVEVVRDS